MVTAYNRKEFVIEAVRSVLGQKYPRSRMEIILLKNFKDREIAYFCEENGIRNILMPDGPVGLYLNYGVENAKYDIIAFLDDDDAFLPDKLSKIDSVFRKNNNIPYYHNLKANIGEEQNYQHEPKIELIDTKALSKRIMIKHVFKAGKWENLSCVAINRKYYREANRILPQLQEVTDLFFLTFAADTGMELCFDETILNVYRFHESASNISAEDTERIIKMEHLFRRYLVAYDLISENVSRNELRSVIAFKSVSFKLYCNVISKTPRVKALRELIATLSKILFCIDVKSLKSVFQWVNYTIKPNNAYTRIVKSVTQK